MGSNPTVGFFSARAAGGAGWGVDLPAAARYGEAMAEAKPVYILIGDDPWLRDQARHAIVAELIGDADPQMCVSNYDGDVDLATVLDDLRTLAFLAPHRVVVVREADGFVSTHRDKLQRYLEAPSSSGSLILLVNAMRTTEKLYKLADKIGQVIPCKPPSARDLPGWITEQARERGAAISRDAALLLAQWTGPNLAQLISELDKLITYVGERGRVEPADVSAIVASSAGPATFDLTNALTAGDLPRALTSLAGMLTTRGEELKTLGLLRWHIQKAVKAAEAVATGANPQQAAASAGVPGFLARDFGRMVQKRGLTKLHGDLRRLLMADLALKSGTDPGAAMRDLVTALCL